MELEPAKWLIEPRKHSEFSHTGLREMHPSFKLIDTFWLVFCTKNFDLTGICGDQSAVACLNTNQETEEMVVSSLYSRMYMRKSDHCQ